MSTGMARSCQSAAPARAEEALANDALLHLYGNTFDNGATISVSGGASIDLTDNFQSNLGPATLVVGSGNDSLVAGSGNDYLQGDVTQVVCRQPSRDRAHRQERYPSTTVRCCWVRKRYRQARAVSNRGLAAGHSGDPQESVFQKPREGGSALADGCPQPAKDHLQLSQCPGTCCFGEDHAQRRLIGKAPLTSIIGQRQGQQGAQMGFRSGHRLHGGCVVQPLGRITFKRDLWCRITGRPTYGPRHTGFPGKDVAPLCFLTLPQSLVGSDDPCPGEMLQNVLSAGSSQVATQRLVGQKAAGRRPRSARSKYRERDRHRGALDPLPVALPVRRVRR